MSPISKKNMEWFDLFIALGAWAVAIYVGYIAFKVGLGLLILK
jgi:hypothetical protein